MANILTHATWLLQEGTTPVAPKSNPWGDIIMLMVIMFIVIYFMMIRPQRKEANRRDQMLKSLKKNDEVMTTSGIIGKFVKSAGNEIVLKVDDDVKIRFHSSAVLAKLEESGESKKEEPARSETEDAEEANKA